VLADSGLDDSAYSFPIRSACGARGRNLTGGFARTAPAHAFLRAAMRGEVAAEIGLVDRPAAASCGRLTAVRSGR
jgi:hypothetical protein